MALLCTHNGILFRLSSHVGLTGLLMRRTIGTCPRRIEWSTKLRLSQLCSSTSRVAGGLAVLGSTAVLALACANPSSTPSSDVEVHPDEDATFLESGIGTSDGPYTDVALRDVSVVDNSIEDAPRPGRRDARDTGPSASRDAADAGCYRDPYLPNRFEAPCEQPSAKANCQVGWCTILPGCFIMGAPWCEPGRAKTRTDPVQVTLTRAFRMGQFEVTQGEWTNLGLPNPSGHHPDGTGDCIDNDCPVGNVTWVEALAFTNAMSSHLALPECYVLEGCTGELGRGMLCSRARSANASIYDCRGYRLPTGAEWEYAARAGTKTAFYAGDIMAGSEFSCADDPELSSISWYCANAGGSTHPIGGKKSNGWGLHDTVGNAFEWVGSVGPPGDGYGEGPYRDHDASLDVTGLLDGPNVSVAQYGQVRGGDYRSRPAQLRVNGTLPHHPQFTSPGSGFRLAQTLFAQKNGQTIPSRSKGRR
jgi:formylglycine-generating enzyme